MLLFVMCWYCGSAINDPEPLGRSLLCTDCGKDLRSCRNCRHFRATGCTETQAEKLSEIEKSNFCDWFSLNPVYRTVTEGVKKSLDSKAAASAKAKSAFDELFK